MRQLKNYLDAKKPMWNCKPCACLTSNCWRESDTSCSCDGGEGGSKIITRLDYVPDAILTYSDGYVNTYSFTYSPAGADAMSQIEFNIIDGTGTCTLGEKRTDGDCWMYFQVYGQTVGDAQIQVILNGEVYSTIPVTINQYVRVESLDLPNEIKVFGGVSGYCSGGNRECLHIHFYPENVTNPGSEIAIGYPGYGYFQYNVDTPPDIIMGYVPDGEQPYGTTTTVPVSLHGEEYGTFDIVYCESLGFDGRGTLPYEVSPPVGTQTTLGYFVVSNYEVGDIDSIKLEYNSNLITPTLRKEGDIVYIDVETLAEGYTPLNIFFTDTNAFGIGVYVSAPVPESLSNLPNQIVGYTGGNYGNNWQNFSFNYSPENADLSRLVFQPTEGSPQLFDMFVDSWLSGDAWANTYPMSATAGNASVDIYNNGTYVTTIPVYLEEGIVPVSESLIPEENLWLTVGDTTEFTIYPESYSGTTDSVRLSYNHDIINVSIGWDGGGSGEIRVDVIALAEGETDFNIQFTNGTNFSHYTHVGV